MYVSLMVPLALFLAFFVSLASLFAYRSSQAQGQPMSIFSSTTNIANIVHDVYVPLNVCWVPQYVL
jgi:hypothetical protein